MYNILVVEDDKKICQNLLDLLNKNGYNSFSPPSFDNIIEYTLNGNFHLVLLDVNLPKYDGYYICKELRKCSNIPIIIITSRNTQIDELMAMNLGSDDFINKPFNTQILLARISNILKRVYKKDFNQHIEFYGITLDLAKSCLIYEDSQIELTKNEMKILHILLKEKGKIVSRDVLMEGLWQSNEFIDDNTLTVNINRLRKKLSIINKSDILQTKRGLGYSIL